MERSCTPIPVDRLVTRKRMMLRNLSLFSVFNFKATEKKDERKKKGMSWNGQCGRLQNEKRWKQLSKAKEI
jgi:hypothetical protein